DASAVERAARKISAGWEAEIALAVEILFPMWLLLDCLNRFGKESPHTRIEVFETVIEGTSEAIGSGAVDLALSPRIPPGMTGERLMPVTIIAVAHPDHPLHKLRTKVTIRNLRTHLPDVLRVSPFNRDKQGAIRDNQRWTFCNTTTSVCAVLRFYGFDWFLEDQVRNVLHEGLLKPLQL